MLIYVNIIKKIKKFFFLFYVNFMLIYVKIIKINKKSFLLDGQTDRRSTQNYSSEPHKTFLSLYSTIVLFHLDFIQLFI